MQHNQDEDRWTIPLYCTLLLLYQVLWDVKDVYELESAIYGEMINGMLRICSKLDLNVETTPAVNDITIHHNHYLQLVRVMKI